MDQSGQVIDKEGGVDPSDEECVTLYKHMMCCMEELPILFGESEG